jgi:hypothetical protein
LQVSDAGSPAIDTTMDNEAAENSKNKHTENALGHF